jgi:hypothetical protein
MRLFLPIILISTLWISFAGCGQKNKSDSQPYFTKTDSLTEIYLSLQDSLHKHWNIMINDDNHKINSMRSLLHELKVTHPENTEQYTALEERLEQLSRMRYTQKSMINGHVVEEYDFASNALIIELVAITESLKEYSYNSTMQKLVDQILTADQNMLYYRIAYDSVVTQFNSFVDQNQDYLRQSEQNLQIEKKPLFQMSAVDNP